VLGCGGDPDAAVDVGVAAKYDAACVVSEDDTLNIE
jgi:hypothetical protein